MRLNDLLTEDRNELLAKIHGIRTKYDDVRARERTSLASAFGKFKIVGNEVQYLSKALKLDCRYMENQELSIPFASAPSVILLDSCLESLKSFRNFPKVITGADENYAFNTDFSFTSGADFIKSFEGFSQIITGDVNLRNNKLTKISLTKINHHIKQIDGILYISKEYKGPLLSTLLIDKLKKVVSYDVQFDALMIKCFNMKDDILGAKELLMSEGHKEWAKL